MLGYVVQVVRELTPGERRRAGFMFGSITALHVIGFGVFVAFVVPSHYRGLGIGVASLAYTLGLRHAFDADHISAIDNTTRKLMNEGKRPLSIGYWFSLGHSSVVVALGVTIVVAEKAVYGAVANPHSTLEQFGGVFGTAVSATFLYLIAALNVVILAGIFRVFRSMRQGEYDEAELERQLQNRGLMYRFFGRWMRTISKEWHMYPVGVVFGLGFDTASEVALLATTAVLATAHLPFYAILCLPILFTAGMALMDTLDGIFMNFAYSWAFFNPVRKVYYNLAITGLSVAICFFIGTIEVLGLLPAQIGGLHGGFW
ncbi:MAG TPA: HoxN/HupN/NixA family nickel/cobalt transporter, partial [Solirubrobacteraceae bacterium]|nr:HoxN/HupN/NixA family nickel/cobalt transporter [Solirubrobacteraceae bacterium]